MSLLKKNTATQVTYDFPLQRKNYILLAIGVFMIFLGFVLMATEGFIDATEFSLSLYVSPFLIIGGFAEIIYALLVKGKTEASDSEPKA